MNSFLLLAAITVMAGPVLTEGGMFGGPSGWIDASGRPIVNSHDRKSVGGFSGALFVTGDPDWYAKWNTPPETVLQLGEMHEVKRGDRVTTLILVVNPRPSEDGTLSVECDLLITRPDGSKSVDAPGVDCLSGPMEGGPTLVRLAHPALEFVAEPNDLPGVWRTQVTLRDLNSGRKMTLHSDVTLHE